MPILVSKSKIQSHIKDLAYQIDDDYAGKTLTALIILKGGAMFALDLLRHVSAPVETEFVEVSS